jgi:hypothetical protein
MKQKDKLVELAHLLLGEEQDIDGEKRKLETFFSKSLVRDPHGRAAGINELLDLLQASQWVLLSRF